MWWHVKHVVNVVAVAGCRCCWYWYWCCCCPIDIFEIGQKDEWSKGSYLFKLNAFHYSTPTPSLSSFPSVSVYHSFVLPLFFMLACFVPFLAVLIRVHAHITSSNTDIGRNSFNCVWMWVCMCFYIFANIQCNRYKEFVNLKLQNAKKNWNEIKYYHHFPLDSYLAVPKISSIQPANQTFNGRRKREQWYIEAKHIKYKCIYLKSRISLALKAKACILEWILPGLMWVCVCLCVFLSIDFSVDSPHSMSGFMELSLLVCMFAHVCISQKKFISSTHHITTTSKWKRIT